MKPMRLVHQGRHECVLTSLALLADEPVATYTGLFHAVTGSSMGALMDQFQWDRIHEIFRDVLPTYYQKKLQPYTAQCPLPVCGRGILCVVGHGSAHAMAYDRKVIYDTDIPALTTWAQFREHWQPDTYCLQPYPDMEDDS